MKQWMLVSAALLLLAPPVSANPSAHFSTAPGTAFAWQLARPDDNWLLSFPINSAQIDHSSPQDASLLLDYVNLPPMAIANLEDHATYLTATLTPTGSFALVSNPGDDTVLTALMAPRSVLFTGTDFVAFSNRADDLDIIDYVPSYSAVIDDITAGEEGGLPLDVSFSGDAAGGVNLIEILRATNGFNRLTGTTLSGQIFIIPVPGALLLAGIGALAAGVLRHHALL